MSLKALTRLATVSHAEIASQKLAYRKEKPYIRATSHTRLRAHDHYISSTLIGGNGDAGPSSLHNTLEGPTEYVSECKMDVKSMWILTWHQMDHVSWSLGLF